MTFRFCVILPCALMMAGCSIGPDYQRPETPAPAAWEAAPAVKDWPSLDWWKSFEAPGLDHLMDRARGANFDIRAAAARIREADAQAKIAGANLWPQVSAQGGESRSRSISTTPRSGGSPRGSEVLSGYFQASYELDFWGKYADAAIAADAAARASRFDAETTQLTVQASVANTYFAAAAAADRLMVANANLDIARKTLDALRGRMEAGTASALDVAQQENVVAAQQALVPPLALQMRQNLNALAILTGAAPETVQISAGSLNVLRLPDVGAGLPSDLLSRRPDLQSAEAGLVAANANLKAAKAAWFPDFKLTAQGGLESAALSTMLDPASMLYSLGASVTQPIFSGGSLEGSVEYQEARRDELVETYRQAVISAYGDVENALLAVDYGNQQEVAQVRAEATASRAYDIASAQLASGTIDVVTLLNTEKTLFQARDALAQARLTHAQAVVTLFRVLGGGWQVAAG